MPHCTIEYSAPLTDVLSIEALVAACHRGLTESELFEPQAIKTRAHRCEFFKVGESNEASFIHLNIAIMPGRSDEQKSLLLERVYNAISLITATVTSVTIEVIDIKQQHYFKALN
ncbi:5-carboxymethyl-2-hydroxymuconate isomerase [Shewanella halifaxensis HAW-EB4]|uniref:5-carboxymethyl-2-hydroxymuconate isomerase n=1 Tax=Shewanella halifaxensis (strain HAW-EB4) TaxID=458817 RepID=B0TPV9_SHEHH|nr:5-carboxymethyl-2-hydroxymuconate Delta-isomerase [Shewanella halifaxensis]ABZ76238.1 5-carboxymethyl-2-hydroxymuconate isomerase [Shewanella halifaxensis HAW-EB4]